MANKNFTQFNTATPLTTADYIVGYKGDGSTEIKTQIQNIANLFQLNSFVRSDTTNTPSASSVNNIVMISFANFMSLTNRDPRTAYLIVDESQVVQ